MTKRNAVVLDADMVLLHWEEGFLKYFNQETENNFEYRPFYQNIANLVGFDREDLEKYIDEYNHTHGFAELEAMPGAYLFLETLKLYNAQMSQDQEVDIFIITKCGKDKSIMSSRIDNLDDALDLKLGEYEIEFLDITESKHDKLAEIKETHNILMFVDDYTSNCDVGVKLHIPTYCVKCYHNEHLEEKKNYLFWVDNMYEATEGLVERLRHL